MIYSNRDLFPHEEDDRRNSEVPDETRTHYIYEDDFDIREDAQERQRPPHQGWNSGQSGRPGRPGHSGGHGGPGGTGRPPGGHGGPGGMGRPPGGPGHMQPRPPRPPRPEQGQPQAPMGPPPPFTPEESSTPSVYAVDPGAIRGCLYRYTYVWLNRRQSFWFFPTFVGRNSVSGYRWHRRRWVYFGIDLQQIRSFQCF